MAEGNRPIRLASGLQWLEQWSARTGQNEQNALYKALFAISDRSAFATYLILEDRYRSDEFLILIRPNLSVKVHFDGLDAFGILYIGTPDEAPGYEVDFRRAS